MINWLEPDQVERMSDGYCPDCGHKGFVLGPRGAAAINIECGGCGARFNVGSGLSSHRFVMAHRIPKRSEGGADWSAKKTAPG
jgi:hypothetical protein